MAISETRKKALAEAVGTEGCITDTSWMTASFQNLNGVLTLYPNEFEYLYSTRECVADEITTQGVVISTYGSIKADVMKDGTKLGTTDSAMIPLASGSHVVTLIKPGYVTQDLAFVVYDGKITDRTVSLTKQTSGQTEETEETTEVPTVTPKGAILRATMNTKIPETLKNGESTWFGWEFENIGDMKWQGIVGTRIKDIDGNTVFEWVGNSAMKQTVQPREIKYLWANMVLSGIPASGDVRISALLTKA